MVPPAMDMGARYRAKMFSIDVEDAGAESTVRAWDGEVMQ